jgi:hypothetical protein
MPYQELFQKIFHKYRPEQDIASYLHEEVKKYPYFGPLHFFLLQETPTGDHLYPQVAAKAALHFSNPFLLNGQLHKKMAAPAIAIPEASDLNTADAPVDIIPAVDETLLIKKEPGAVLPPPEKEELLFEPLYTTDYFASQGIRLSEEIQSGDKLGKQLKSFTEWLKTMKKVQGNKLPDNGEPVDQVVQQLAEKSNKEEEVLTESMAEVYIQQGRPRKAQEIYEKLSLLNPSKSAYFAAKIDLLNNK